ncbi:MAG: TetR/AcrR family transcriptional regulator [Actinomycetota bacterium]
MGQRKTSRSGLETRDRIIDAALETVRTEGLVGTSVRVIARTGGFNQALVFYHFGSVEELLLAALERANERRMGRFRSRLEQAETLSDLVAVGMDLHATEADPDHPALTAIVAGWSTSSDMGPRIVEILKPWDDLVAGALRRSLAGTSFEGVAPVDDLAHAISALFMGIEVFERLDGDQSRADSLFDSLARAAKMADPLLKALSGSALAASVEAAAANRSSN